MWTQISRLNLPQKSKLVDNVLTVVRSSKRPSRWLVSTGCWKLPPGNPLLVLGTEIGGIAKPEFALLEGVTEGETNGDHTSETWNKGNEPL